MRGKKGGQTNRQRRMEKINGHRKGVQVLFHTIEDLTLNTK